MITRAALEKFERYHRGWILLLAFLVSALLHWNAPTHGGAEFMVLDALLMYVFFDFGLLLVLRFL